MFPTSSMRYYYLLLSHEENIIPCTKSRILLIGAAAKTIPNKAIASQSTHYSQNYLTYSVDHNINKHGNTKHSALKNVINSVQRSNCQTHVSLQRYTEYEGNLWQTGCLTAKLWVMYFLPSFPYRLPALCCLRIAFSHTSCCLIYCCLMTWLVLVSFHCLIVVLP